MLEGKKKRNEKRKNTAPNYIIIIFKMLPTGPPTATPPCPCCVPECVCPCSDVEKITNNFWWKKNIERFKFQRTWHRSES